MTLESDSFLVYLLLIISAIALFLCILNMISLHELSRKLKKARNLPRKSQKKPEEPGPGTGSGTVTEGSPGEGIESGIGRIVRKYGLDSLTIAGTDGLAIASSGSIDPEFEAAYYTDILARHAPVPDNQVRLFELSYEGMPLIGIARGGNEWQEDTDRLKSDILAVCEKYLGIKGGFPGEAI